MSDAFLIVAFLLGYLLRLDPVRPGADQTCRHAGSALDRFRQYRRHQRAAHRPQGPRRGDADRRHAQGHGRGHDRRLLRRRQCGDAGRARRLPRPPLSGLAQIQRRQGRRHLYRRADRPVLAGGGDVLPDLAGDRRHHALLVALGAGRSLRHAAVPVVVRPPGAGLAVRRADAAAVLEAQREHQAAAGRHRRTDRGEEHRRSPDERSESGTVPGFAALIRATLSRLPARQTAPPPAPAHRRHIARSPARRPAIRLPRSAWER